MSNIKAKPRSKLVRSASNQPGQPLGNTERSSGSSRTSWASERRNTLSEPSAPCSNDHRSCQTHCCQQLAERIHELQREIRGDVHPSQISSLFSPFSPVTPASNISAGGGGYSLFPHSQSFSINLNSPHTSVPTQRYSLSSKMLEHAHRIPERFWMDWQDKQKQHRLGELESIKHTLSSPLYSILRPNDPLSSTLHRRKSLLLLHNAHQQRRLSRPMMSIEDPPSPTTTDSQQSLETIQQNDADSLVQSISHCRVSEPVNERSSATLDRSRLTIALPYSLNTTHASAGTPPSPEPIFIPDSRSDYEVSPTSSLDDVAEIDTELNVTFLSQENQAEANLVLYSKAIIHRSVAFRSLSPRKNTRETGVDKEDSIS